MEVSEYVTLEEVKRICKAIGLSDWNEKTDPSVSEEEASMILNIVNTKSMEIPLEDFRKGLEVELEHGIRFEDANRRMINAILTERKSRFLSTNFIL